MEIPHDLDRRFDGVSCVFSPVRGSPDVASLSNLDLFVAADLLPSIEPK